MKQRILVAVVGVPALLAVLCAAPDWATLALLMGLCIIASHELLAAVLPPEKTRRWWGLAATLAVFVVANVYFSHERFTGTAAAGLMPWLVAALVVVVFLCMVLEYGKKRRWISRCCAPSWWPARPSRWLSAACCGCGCWSTVQGWC